VSQAFLRPEHRVGCRRTLGSLLVAASLVCAFGCTTAAGFGSTRPRGSKIGPELISLHEQYASHLAAGLKEPFRPANPTLHLVEDRVVIDAVAAGDPAALQKDLAALGMIGAATFGRIVSGQLPITSIPALERLSSLRFARAAIAVSRGGGRPADGPS
jgi:hypothetical protein